jgi:DNA-binding NarL/FixJ family response regulator
MLTSFSDDEALFNAIMAGASGYVLKQIKSDDLVGTGHQGGGRTSLLDPQLSAMVLDRLRNGDEQDERLKHLTDQERRILGYLADGLTNRQIADEMFLAEKTVRTTCRTCCRRWA